MGMHQNLSLAISTSPSDAEMQELRDRLVEFNTSRVGPSNYTPILLTLRDDAGKLAAGVAGHAYFEWLFLEMLWVAEPLRGQGRGSMLMRAAEEEGRRLGCHEAWLDTFSFQAKDFHERDGYVVFGQLPDYPPGHQRWFMRKSLDPSATKGLTPFELDDRFYSLLSGGARYFLLISALEANLPAVLAGGPLDAAEIVSRLRFDPHRGRKWLHALQLAGLLEATEKGFQNSPTMDALFARPGEAWFYREFLRFWRSSASHNLPDVLRGAPVLQDVRYPPQDPEGVEWLHSWMRNTTVGTLATIVKCVDFRPVRKLLDVAGGDGTMATLLARSYPSLSITIFNIPAAVAMAKVLATNNKLTGRIDTVAGDFRHHPFPSGYDMVLFSRVMADWSPEVCRLLMTKSHGALAPGGKLVICEPLQDQNPNLAIAWEHSYLPYDDFGLGVYKPLSTYERLLRETGFRVLYVVPRDETTIHCVIVAERVG